MKMISVEYYETKQDLPIGKAITGSRINRVVDEYPDNPEYKCLHCAAGRNDCYCKKLLCNPRERKDNKHVYWKAY